MSIRLGIDASQPVASCAVSTGHEIIADFTMDKPIENFPLLIRKTLSHAKIGFKDIDEIIVCTGPGSQTGVRTAVVTANTLGMALGKPVVGVLSIDAAAAIALKEGPYNVAVSAGRSRWYEADYSLSEGLLCRMGEIQLIDKLPEGMKPSFKPASSDCDCVRTCAYGCLLIAEKHRQLIVQPSNRTVLPYEH